MIELTETQEITPASGSLGMRKGCVMITPPQTANTGGQTKFVPKKISKFNRVKHFHAATVRVFARTFLADARLAFLFEGNPMKNITLFVAAICVLVAAPASAAMMTCSSDNMSKTTTMMMTMPESPNKMMMNKEMGMANMEMSKGNSRGACMHYMRAQKMGMMKSGGMMNSGM
jgi:hypothetical protein